jgi:hypothetical protein
MALNRKARAWLVVLLGILLVAAGAWMIFPPAGLVVGGVGVVAVGLFAFDVGDRA